MSGISFGRYFNVEGRAASTPAPDDGSVIFLPDTVPAALPTSAAITGDTGVTLRYPGTPTASGQLTVTGSCSTMQPVSVALNYGSLSLAANGAWTYTLDTSNPQVQQLLEDVSLLDAYPVWAADGTAGVTLTATIWGRQVVITGTTSTAVRLGGQESGGGQLTVTGGSGLLTPITRTLTYGTITVTAAGVWTYTLDPTNPAVIALGPNDHVSDSIVVRTQDGRGSVTLQAAVWGRVQVVITGTTSTTLRLGGTQTGGGALTVTGGSGKMANLVQPLTYGTITMTDNAWSYTLDPSNPTLTALSAAQSVTDNYTAWSSDNKGSVDLAATVYGKAGFAELLLGMGPLGYWKLDEASGTSAADSAGYKAGVYQGTPTLAAPAIRKGASASMGVGLAGDGDVSQLFLAHDSRLGALIAAGKSMTVGVWFKFAGYQGWPPQGGLFRYARSPGYSSGAWRYLWAEGGGDRQAWSIGPETNAGPAISFYPVYAFGDSTPTLFVCTKSADGHIRAYRDGVLRGTGGSGGTSCDLDAPADSYGILVPPASAPGFPVRDGLRGWFSDFFIFERELTAAEIAALYNAGKP